MKKILTIVISIITILIVSLRVSAATYGFYTLTLTKVSDTPDTTHIKDPHKGNRIPPRQIVCTISPEGISITSVNESDITLYEVYDLDDNCLGSFTNDNDFVTYLFSNNGDYEMRIHTNEYVLYGAVSISM